MDSLKEAKNRWREKTKEWSLKLSHLIKVVTQPRIPLLDRFLVNNSLSLVQHQTWEQVIMQQLILGISPRELLNWIIQEAVVLNKIASTTLWIKATRVELVVLFLLPFPNWKRINNSQHLASSSVQDLLCLPLVVQQMQIPTQEDLHFYNSTKETVEKCLPCLVERLSRIDLLSSRQIYQPFTYQLQPERSHKT